MLGFNGGLMGVRKVPTTGTASGLWFQNEQSVAKRAGIWPLGTALDPDFASVSLLLHMDGSNGSTTFTDSSSSALTVTTFGTAAVSTTAPRFGTGALYLLGTSSNGYITVNASSALSFPGDFTVEAWVRRDSTGSDANAIIYAVGDYTNGLWLRLRGVSYCNNINLGDFESYFAANTYSFTQVVRSGTTLKVNIDGVERASVTISATVNVFNQGMRIGDSLSSGAQYPAGYFDDIRVTKGVARANVVPTAPFPDA